MFKHTTQKMHAVRGRVGTNGCTLNTNNKNILGNSSQLNTLANNGDLTQAISLQSSSAALDVIPANKCLDETSNPLAAPPKKIRSRANGFFLG